MVERLKLVSNSKEKEKYAVQSNINYLPVSL